MAAPAQSPLRRWKPFFGAFDSVDAAIEAADPVLSRVEFRRIRGDIVERLCDAANDDHAERLCLVLDDVMAESLETLRLVPAMPTVLATTDLGKRLRALREHESERVRLLASGIVKAWSASVHDDLARVGAALHKLDSVPERQAPTDARTKRPVKIPETLAKKTVEIAKKTVEIAKKASEPVVRGNGRAELCSEERVEAAKRNFQHAYKEADDAKRRRRTPMVEAPEMLKQGQQKMHRLMREPSRARCASSMVKKTITVTRLAS